MEREREGDSHYNNVWDYKPILPLGGIYLPFLKAKSHSSLSSGVFVQKYMISELSPTWAGIAMAIKPNCFEVCFNPPRLKTPSFSSLLIVAPPYWPSTSQL